MKQLFISLIIALLSFVCVFNAYSQEVPAFPGAEGGGKYTTGGRGGKVLYVTSLADDGSQGTLRWAINQSGKRIIMFKVSGVIDLTKKISITNGDLTIAGQTAPGDGICIRNYEISVSASNVIIRYLRFRHGDLSQNEQDAIWGRYQSNLIIDHCSMSWSIDECSSFYSNKDFTMQWCILSEALNKSYHEKDAHSYGGIWGGENATFHHNLLAHNNSRNPRFNGYKRSGLGYVNPQKEERLDYRNNVVYNWGDNSSYGGESRGKYNMVANYYKHGPGTSTNVRYRLNQIDIDADVVNYSPGYGTYYIAENYMYGSSGITNDNWSGVLLKSGVSLSVCKALVPFECVPIPQHTAEDAYEKVLQYAGASLVRDAVDTRVTTEVKNGTATYSGSKTGKKGIIDSQTDVGGWPVYTYEQTNVPVDTDSDGMPDDWELANGLNPNDASDGPALASGKGGYTNLDMYLASLVDHISVAQVEGVTPPEKDSNNTIVNMTINGKVATISNDENVIVAGFRYRTSYGDWPVEFTLASDEATADFTSGNTHNFSEGPLTITVTAGDSSTKTYVVSVNIANNFAIGILSANGKKETYDDLLESAFNDYIVEYLAAEATAPADINEFYGKYDLIVIHSNVSGANATLRATRNMVGVMPVLSLKAFAYQSGRWDWTSAASQNTQAGTISSSVGMSLQNHNIFENVAFEGEVLKFYTGETSTPKNAIQAATAFNGANWTAALNNANHIIATVNTENAGIGTQIHEINLNNAAKYIMIGLSQEDNSFTSFNANTISILKNTVRYLLNPDAYYDYDGNIAYHPQISKPTVLSYTPAMITDVDLSEEVTIIYDQDILIKDVDGIKVNGEVVGASVVNNRTLVFNLKLTPLTTYNISISDGVIANALDPTIAANGVSFSFTTIKDILTSIEILTETLNIYPTRTSGIVNIDGENIIAVNVLAYTGQLVKQAVNDMSYVDLSNLSGGIYLIKVWFADCSVKTQKVVLQK